MAMNVVNGGDEKEESSSSSSSRLFEGYRTVGLCSSDVPHLVRYVEKLNKIQIITAVGRSFLVYNQKLQLIETCVAHTTDINVLAADSRFLFTAADCEIFAWKYGHKWKVKSFTGAQSPIHSLLVLGVQLIALDRASTLYVWDIHTQELQCSLPFRSSSSSSSMDTETDIVEIIDDGDDNELTTMFHPATYINKILLGFASGELQLWNIAKQKLIYKFDGWHSKVTKIVQAPALHIAAIGHESGLIVLHHLQKDETLIKFYQEWGPIADIAFRTDDAAIMPMMVTTCATLGHLAVWNLDQQRLETALYDLHQGPIVGATFVSKQPLLVTNTSENAIKVYVFDDIHPTSGRLLYAREGHRLPPTRIRFYGHRGHYIVSSGLDSTLRAFFIYSERKNRSLGTAAYNQKQYRKKSATKKTNTGSGEMEPIWDFTFETTREKEWNNLMAIHRDTPFVTSWSFDRMKMGEHRLCHERFDGAKVSTISVHAECLSMTSCGNFVLIGYNTGHVDRFNVQSGIHRASYGLPLTVGGGSGDSYHTATITNAPAHDGIVRGVLADGLNQTVISGGSDRLVKFWRFNRPTELIGTLKLTSPVSQMHLHRENSLLAIAQDNFQIIIVDIETKKVVRRFVGHQARITDFTFDIDCRRLYVSSMDSFIYVWDMITGMLVDGFRTTTPCVSLTISPTGEFLATAHVNDVGIYLWANLATYSRVLLTPLKIENVQQQRKVLRLPQIRSDDEINDDIDDEDEEDGDRNEKDQGREQNDDGDDNPIDLEYRSPEQLSTELITLSNLSSSRWKNLLQLDLIRKRNKPIEPVEKPKQAPFFLPTIAGLKPKFSFENENDASSIAAKKEQHNFRLRFMSEFIQALDRLDDNDDGEESSTTALANVAFNLLKSYGPSQIDAEIRSLAPESTIDGSRRYLLNFLRMLQIILHSKRDFELVQSYLALYLRCHLDSLTTSTELVTQCQSIATLSDQCWTRLEEKFDRSICLINYLRNALI